MKYKKIPKSYIKICLDRLTRFKPVYEKYNRVFFFFLNKFLISSDTAIGEFLKSPENMCNAVCEIFNSSVPFEYDSFISDILLKEEKTAFALDDTEMKFLNSGLNLTGAIKYISDDANLPKNLKYLKLLLENKENTFEFLRKKHSLLYPVTKIVLTEGATEEILLSEFAQKLGYDFNKEGILIIGAGGKNQVARKYYKMADEVKLPIFILLDYDADETKELILPKLKTKDEIYVIKTGEFEDILPLELIIQSINANFSNNLHCSVRDFDSNLKMTKNLHNLFKNKGFGEYKKAEFAKMVKNFMENSSENIFKSEIKITSEIFEIIERIKNMRIAS